MTSWQKRARLMVAVFGIACAVVVYFAIGRRPPAAAPAAVKRIDPAASAEGVGGTAQRLSGEKRDFQVASDTQLTYPDGRSHLTGHITVTVTKDDGRTFVATAGEAETDKDQSVVQLSSGVTLKANDGFTLTTDRATYTHATGSFHSDVPIAFAKGRMSGSGTAVDYNENNDVLTIGQDAHVTTVDEQGEKTLEFTSGTAVFDRRQDLLTLDGTVHVIRDMQLMDADHAVGHLAPNDEFVTFIELRSNSRVAGGGGSLEAMNARDIDLDYTDDGKLLERVALNGGAVVRMAGTKNTGGRELKGEALEVRLAPDNSVTGVTDRENVQMTMPAADGGPPRTIRARTLDATGVPGQGLTAAHFTDAVEYREDPIRDLPLRVVHSRVLDLALANDAVSSAIFTTDVSFDESAFRAQAAEAKYDPAAGTLHLARSDGRGLPCVADDQISVDAQTIDVTVETRRLKAQGTVRTELRPRGAPGGLASSPCAIARQRAGLSANASRPPAGETRLPGLLKQDQVARITADSLDYEGSGKPLTYTGNASLVQGDATIRGNVLWIDQEAGDLVVTGGAHSRTTQGTGADGERIDGTAEEIRYSDRTHELQYLSAPASPSARSASKPKAVRVITPQSDLQAMKVELFLNEQSKVERLEGFDKILAKIGSRTATGNRLTYSATDDTYELHGAPDAQVRIFNECSESSGNALIYRRSTDETNMIGNNVMRTQVKSGGTCSATPTARPTSR